MSYLKNNACVCVCVRTRARIIKISLITVIIFFISKEKIFKTHITFDFSVGDVNFPTDNIPSKITNSNTYAIRKIVKANANRQLV